MNFIKVDVGCVPVKRIAFYHQLGLARIAVRPDGVAASRRVKPSIPMHDEHGRAIAGEVDFELPL